MKKYNIGFFAAFLVTIIGIFILSYSLYTIILYLVHYNTYPQVNGEVIGYSYGQDNTSAMVISYKVNGTEYKITSNFDDSELLDVKSKIVVRYNKKKPENYILGDEDLKFGRTIVGGSISLVGVFGMVISFPSKKKKNIKGE